MIRQEWVFNWRRDWFVWESRLLDQPMDKLQSCNFVQGERDFWLWPYDNSCLFSVTSASATLHDLRMGSEVDEILRRVWDLETPLKTQFMMLRLLLDRLPTKVNLVRRNISFDEIADHMFLYCNEIYSLWNKFCNWFNCCG